ncbi:MAG: 3-isopropylmalate dehydratase small subunit [Sediminibacterium sp.]|nr:3-isopropylmalate dehydratase small subunit [Sediminibacterium sp.]
MDKINIIHGTFVPLAIENVDTDQIIPARFLKATTKLGFGKNLFRDWRYLNDQENEPITDFVLNNPLYSGSILVSGKNFGCGSSREHAAWALKDYGFKVVISSFFADIFQNNALNNGVLPVVVSEQFLQELFLLKPQDSLTINISNKTIQIDHNQHTESFPLNDYKQTCFLNGYEDIDYLLSIRNHIETYEQQRKIKF